MKEILLCQKILVTVGKTQLNGIIDFTNIYNFIYWRTTVRTVTLTQLITGTRNALKFSTIFLASQAMGMESSNLEEHVIFKAHGNPITKYDEIHRITKTPDFLEHFPQLIDGSDGNRDCEQQALLIYHIICKVVNKKDLTSKEVDFLLKVMLITPKRELNKFGHLVKFKDNGFVGCGMNGDYKNLLQTKVAEEILEDVKERLDQEHKEDCKKRLILGKDYSEESTGLKRFSAVENMTAFLRGVKDKKIPLLLTITKTEINDDGVKLSGIDNILFQHNGEKFILLNKNDITLNLPCIQIMAVSQLKDVKEGDFEAHINNISQNLEDHLVEASFKESLANGEEIPKFLIESTILSKEVLKRLEDVEHKEERMINESGDNNTVLYNKNTVLFAVTHVRCATLNYANKRSEITMNSSKSELEPTKIDDKQTTDPYEVFKKIKKVKLEIKS